MIFEDVFERGVSFVRKMASKDLLIDPEHEEGFSEKMLQDEKIGDVFSGIDQQLLKIRQATTRPEAEQYLRRVQDGCAWIARRLEKHAKEFRPAAKVEKMGRCLDGRCWRVVVVNDRPVCELTGQPIFDITECPNRSRWFRVRRSEDNSDTKNQLQGQEVQG